MASGRERQRHAAERVEGDEDPRRAGAEQPQPEREARSPRRDRADAAPCQSTTSSDSVTIGSADRPNGANPNTVAAPAASAKDKRSAPARLHARIAGARRRDGHRQRSRDGDAAPAAAGRRARQRLDLQRVEPAAVRADDAEAVVADVRRLAALGQAAECLQHEPAHRVELVVGEVGAEVRVEIADLGLRLHAMATVRLGDDVVLALVEVVLVLDVADDLLQHVLDRDEPRHAAVLVDDDRDVVAVGAEIAQEDVQALRFGHEHGGPQRLLEVEAVGVPVVEEQLLREQDADDVVLVLADHREPGVLGLEHQRQELGRLVVDRDDVHLGARDHDVAHGHLGHLQHALDHRQRVGVEELVLERAVQELEQLVAVLGLAREERGQPLEQRRLAGLVAALVVHGSVPGAGRRTERARGLFIWRASTAEA